MTEPPTSPAFDPRFGPDERESVAKVIDSQVLWRGNGPGWGADRVSRSVSDQFEDAFATTVGLPFVLAVNSGTSANEAALASLGLQPGSEVICPAASPIFVPFSVLAVGCVPVFADVDADTLVPRIEHLERVLTRRTRAIIVVHLWGRPADIKIVVRFANDNGLKVIEDCAQAPATTVAGQRVGTFGDASCFSLQQSKLISSGEGGIVATRDRRGYARAALYSNSGIPNLRFGISADEIGCDPRAIGHFGHNHRMGEMQAAIALSQLGRIDEFVESRAQAVHAIEEEVRRLAHHGVTQLPPVDDASISYWRYPVKVPAGKGNYVGIPALEPIFRRIQIERRTPFGVPISDDVSYREADLMGAITGANGIRAVPLQHGMSATEAKNQTRKTLTWS